MKYVKLAALARALTAPVRTAPPVEEAPPSTKRAAPSRTAPPISAPPKTVRDRRG